MPNAQLRDILTYYEEAGAGEPLVLVMGLGGDLQAWRFQVQELSKHFRVITFDNRGAGRTSAPDRPYSIKGMAEDLNDLLDVLKIEKTHILGYSMGGYIAQEFALAYPKRVDRLILLATGPAIDGYGRAVVSSWIDVRSSNMSREQVARHNAPWLYSPELLDNRERYEQAIRNSLANRWEQEDYAFIRQAQAILAWEPGDRASAIKAPTLIVAGEDDILVPARNAEALGKLIPGSTVKLLPGGHVGCIEYADEYNSAFLEHLGAAVTA
jgi:pimeloyl-ACP methyl ester carboxylesterase